MSKYRAETITVNNNFAVSNAMAWVYAYAAASGESLTVFDDKKRLLHYNDRFGTLAGADSDDLQTIYTVFAYYGKFYTNWIDALGKVRRVFASHCPVEFELKHSEGWSCRCRAFPVLDNGQLGGVVLVAHRIFYGPELQIGGYACAELQHITAAPQNQLVDRVHSWLFDRFASRVVPLVFLAISACGGPGREDQPNGYPIQTGNNSTYRRGQKMRILILVVVLLMMGGCAPQMRTKQTLLAIWSSPKLTNEIVDKYPSVEICFGSDRAAAKSAFSAAQKKATNDMADYMPALVNGREIEAYAVDWGTKSVSNFFADYGQNFSVAGLSHKEAKDCLGFYHENKPLFPEKVAQK